MFPTNLILFWFLCSFSNTSARNKDNGTLHSIHRNLMNGFRCQKPQPRCMTVKELLKEDLTLQLLENVQTINPQCTVLYRCKHSGCCDNGELCQPKLNTTHRVKLMFHLEIGKGGNRQSYYRSLTPLNHTECHCSNFMTE